MRGFLDLVRWKNVMITAIYQAILYFYLIVPAFKMAQVQPQLGSKLFILFIICTVSIVISANVINDIFDIKIDTINKPTSPLVSGALTSNTAWRIYYASLFLGFSIAFQVAFAIHKVYLVGIYIGMQALMFYYSRSLKKKGLLGNIVVALSIAFVSLVMLISEPKLLTNSILNQCITIILGFSTFVFFINLARELVKDIEDIDGDQSNLLNTFPINNGVRKSKILIGSILVTLILLLVAWVLFVPNLDFRMKVYPLIILIGPIGLSAFRLYKAEIKSQYSKISKLLKYIIMFGLIYFFLIVQYFYH